MSVDTAIPSDIQQAAELLQRRLDLLKSHSERVGVDEWTMLDSRIRDCIPKWLTAFHTSFQFRGCVLMTMDPSDEYRLYFRFCVPETLKVIFESEEYFNLFEAGYFPIGEESNDNLWLLKDGPDGEVFWFRSTAWDGSPEGVEDAVTFASGKLSHLMLSMEIGNDNRAPANGAMWSRIESDE